LKMESELRERLLAELNQRIEAARLNIRAAELARFDFIHGWDDFFYFSKRILSYEFDVIPHRESCAFLADPKKLRKLFLAPRGAYKTSQMSQAYPIWRIVKNPNIRGLLDSVSLTNSENNNKVIERHLEHNQMLRFLYGDHSGNKSQKWNDSEFVSARRNNISLKESTITTGSLGKIQIGPHYDLIVADDEHDKDNTKTVEQILNVKQHIRLLFGLLEPNGEIIIGGHRWNYNDAYSMLLGDTDNPDEQRFAEWFKDGLYVKSAEDEHGNLYFPRVLNRDVLKRHRDTLGRDYYNAMLMNDPVVTGDNSTFDGRNFKVYKAVPAEAAWFLTIDPGGEKKKSDEWVFFLGAMDQYINKYFVRYIKTICRISEAAEIIYQFLMRGDKANLADAKRRANNPAARPIIRKGERRSEDGEEDPEPAPRLKKIGFEVSGQQGTICTSIAEYIWNKYKVALPIAKLVHNTDSKTERIEAMGPEYEMGKIYHSPQMSEPRGLEDQLLKFPKGKDDIADAAAMQREVAKAPRVIREEQLPANADEAIARRLYAMERNRGIQRQHPILGTGF